MRAAVFAGHGKPLEIREVPDPAPGPRELLLRVRGCGICGSDLHVSELPLGLAPGTVMGHEFSGEVVEVGREASGGFRVGERVCALPLIGCGRCAACLSGDGTRCPEILATGLGGVPGAYAEYVRVDAAETLRLPEAVSHRRGALVEPLAVGLHAVHRAALPAGARVLVVGAGPIGLATALWARFLGARDVVVSERAPGRRELAGRFGASGVIDPGREDVAERFAELAGAPPDVVFECVGAPGLIQECIGLAAPRGTLAVVGVCMQPDSLVPAAAVVKELSIRFAVAYRKQDFELTLAMLEQGRIASDEMVTDVVDLDGFAAAFEALKRPTTQCKVVLEP
jgi:(R,R)-butanediol dehydrogenase / meso-butanediol dehydrogenase / diacetyl reductase